MTHSELKRLKQRLATEETTLEAQRRLRGHAKAKAEEAETLVITASEMIFMTRRRILNLENQIKNISGEEIT